MNFFYLPKQMSQPTYSLSATGISDKFYDSQVNYQKIENFPTNFPNGECVSKQPLERVLNIAKFTNSVRFFSDPVFVCFSSNTIPPFMRSHVEPDNRKNG